MSGTLSSLSRGLTKPVCCLHNVGVRCLWRRFVLWVCLAFLLAACLADGQSAQPEAQTEPLKADDIMARVAANQDRSQALRKEYVYKQHIHIATHKPQKRMMREETADYDVVPLPDGTQKQLKSLTGRYWNKGK